MIGKQYFEETFSLETAQALQAWANTNLITPTLGDYAMKIEYAENGGSLMFAETELTGLTIGDSYTIRGYVDEIVSNAYRIYVNALPNDNSSFIAEGGYGLGWREESFIATATTMYLAIGDNDPVSSTYSTIDSISVKDSTGTNFVTNGTFEANNTTGWYGQDANTVLSTYAYASTPPVDNPYLETVSIPAYDSGNSEHVLITTSNGNWSLINTEAHKHFYVEPGDYGDVTITRSGTDVNRRTISLYNGNDTHPGALPTNEVMSLNIELNASYWTFDRYSCIDNSGIDTKNLRIGNAGSNNIINRAYFDETNQSIDIGRNCNNNTIQKSRIQQMRAGGITSDYASITMFHWQNDYEIQNLHIVLCEIVNSNDGIQPNRNIDSSGTGTYQAVSFPGLVIDSCNIWADATRNNPLENGIDLKGGSLDAGNPVTITNNNLWGWNDTACDGDGVAVVGHYNPENIVFEDNVLFNTNIPINTGSAGSSTGYGNGFVNCSVKRNLFYNCGQASNGHEVLTIGSMINTQVEDNVLIDCEQGMIRAYGNDSNCTFQLNDVCNTPFVWEDRGSNASSFVTSVANNTEYATATAGGYTEDLIINYDIYTDTPKQITLTNAVKP